jgi:hypothetical protein
VAVEPRTLGEVADAAKQLQERIAWVRDYL